MAESGDPHRSASFYRRDHEHEWARDRGPPSRATTYEEYRHGDRRPSFNRRYSDRRSASPERPDVRRFHRSPTRNGYGSRARSSSRPAERIPYQSPRDTQMTNSASFTANKPALAAASASGPQRPAKMNSSTNPNASPSAVPTRDPRLVRKLSTNIPRDGNSTDSPKSPYPSSPFINNAPPHKLASNLPNKPSAVSNLPDQPVGSPGHSENPTKQLTASRGHAKPAASKETTETSIPTTSPALLGAILDNASMAAAFRMEKRQIESKAENNERVDKRLGAAARIYPAFVEASTKTQKATQHALTECNEKLAVHERKQTDLVSRFLAKTEVQTSLVKRCIAATEVSTTAVTQLQGQVSENNRLLDEVTTQLEKAPSDKEVQRLHSQYQPLTERVVKVEQRLDEREDAAQKMKDHVQFSLDSFNRKHTALESQLCEFEANREKEVHKSSIQHEVESLRQTANQMKSQIEKFEETAAHVPPALGALATNKEDFKTFQENLLDQWNTVRQSWQSDMSELQAEIGRVDEELEAEKELRRLDQKSDRALATAAATKHVLGIQPDLNEASRSALLTEVHGIFDDKQKIEDTRDSLIMMRMDELAQMITDRDDKESKREEDMTALRNEYTTEVARRKAVEGENSAIATALARFVESINRNGRTTEAQVQGGDGNSTSNVQASLGLLEKVMTAQNRSWASSPLSAPPTPKLAQGQSPTPNQTASAQLTIHTQQQPPGQLQIQAAVPAHVQNTMNMPRPQAQGQGQGYGQGHGQTPPPVSSLPSVLGQLPLNISAETRKRFERVELAIRSLIGNYQSVVTATQSLDTRFNNLTTENVVQSMAHQFNTMYPFALTAQQEISKLIRELGQVKKMVPVVDRLKNVADRLTSELLRFSNSYNAQIANISNRLTQLENEKAALDTKHKTVMDGVHKARESLTTQISEHGERLDRGESRLAKLEKDQEGSPLRMEYLAEKITEKISDDVDQKMKELQEQFRRHHPDNKRRELLEKFNGGVQGQKRGLETDTSGDSENSSNSSIALASRSPRQDPKVSELLESSASKVSRTLQSKPTTSPRASKGTSSKGTPSKGTPSSKKRKTNRGASPRYLDNLFSPSPVRKRKS